MSLVSTMVVSIMMLGLGIVVLKKVNAAPGVGTQTPGVVTPPVTNTPATSSEGCGGSHKVSEYSGCFCSDRKRFCIRDGKTCKMSDCEKNGLECCDKDSTGNGQLITTNTSSGCRLTPQICKSANPFFATCGVKTLESGTCICDCQNQAFSFTAKSDLFDRSDIPYDPFESFEFRSVNASRFVEDPSFGLKSLMGVTSEELNNMLPYHENTVLPAFDRRIKSMQNGYKRLANI